MAYSLEAFLVPVPAAEVLPGAKPLLASQASFSAQGLFWVGFLQAWQTPHLSAFLILGMPVPFLGLAGSFACTNTLLMGTGVSGRCEHFSLLFEPAALHQVAVLIHAQCGSCAVMYVRLDAGKSMSRPSPAAWACYAPERFGQEADKYFTSRIWADAMPSKPNTLLGGLLLPIGAVSMT